MPIELKSDALKNLKAVRTLLSDEQRFARFAFAYDKKPILQVVTETSVKEVYPTDPAATCWCVAGAFIKTAYGDPEGQEQFKEANVHDLAWELVWDIDGWQDLNQTSSELYSRSPDSVNDSLGYHQILRVLDLTIAKLEKPHAKQSN